MCLQEVHIYKPSLLYLISYTGNRYLSISQSKAHFTRGHPVWREVESVEGHPADLAPTSLSSSGSKMTVVTHVKMAASNSGSFRFSGLVFLSHNVHTRAPYKLALVQSRIIRAQQTNFCAKSFLISGRDDGTVKSNGRPKKKHMGKMAYTPAAAP